MLFEKGGFKIVVQYGSFVKKTGIYYKSFNSIPCGILAEIFSFPQTFPNVVTWFSHGVWGKGGAGTGTVKGIFS